MGSTFEVLSSLRSLCALVVGDKQFVPRLQRLRP